MNNFTIGKKGLDLIREFEGYHTRLPDGRCQAYLDKIGTGQPWTIGYGCTTGVYPGLIWTHEKAIQELKKEITTHELEVKRLVRVPLNQNQFDALTSLSYNMGLSRAKTLLSALNSGDYGRAASCFTLYTRSGGQVRRGLIRRREAEQRLFNTLPPKEVVDNSVKLTWLRRLRNFLISLLPAGGLAEWLGVLDQVKEFIVSNRMFFIVGGVLAAWLLFKWLEYRSVKDHEEGNYVPSGVAAEQSANSLAIVDEVNTEESSSQPDIENGPNTFSSTMDTGPVSNPGDNQGDILVPRDSHPNS